MWMLELQWWIYFLAATVIFLSLLLVNFVVKKINETRLDERFNNLQTKANNEFTQVQTPLIEIESKKMIPPNIVPLVSSPRKSIVFDNNATVRDKNEVNKNSVSNLNNVSDSPNKDASPSRASVHSKSSNTCRSKTNNYSFKCNIRPPKTSALPSKLTINDIPPKSHSRLPENNCPPKSNDRSSKSNTPSSKSNAISPKSNDRIFKTKSSSPKSYDIISERNTYSSENNAHTSKSTDLSSKTTVPPYRDEGTATASQLNNLQSKSNTGETKINDSNVTPSKYVDNSNVSNKVIIKDSESSYRILNNIVDRMVTKMNESKTTPNTKKLIDVQNKADLKEWVSDLIKDYSDEEKVIQTKTVPLKKMPPNPDDERN